MARNLSFVIAAAVIIGTGVLHGYRSNRWGNDGVLLEAAARLDRVPATIGDWTGTDQEVGEEFVKKAEASRIFSRNYVNEKDGRAISVLIVCGRPGPVAVHTPEVCFTGQGQRQRDEKEKSAPTLNADSGHPQDVEFWTADFFKPADLIPRYQRVFWSWSENGEWLAPDNPRPKFMWKNKLYKLYLVRMVPPNEEPNDEELDPAIEFAEMLIPQLNEALFGQTPSQPST